MKVKVHPCYALKADTARPTGTSCEEFDELMAFLSKYGIDKSDLELISSKQKLSSADLSKVVARTVRHEAVTGSLLDMTLESIKKFISQVMLIGKNLGNRVIRSTSTTVKELLTGDPKNSETYKAILIQLKAFVTHLDSMTSRSYVQPQVGDYLYAYLAAILFKTYAPDTWIKYVALFARAMVGFLENYMKQVNSRTKPAAVSTPASTPTTSQQELDAMKRYQEYVEKHRAAGATSTPAYAM